MAEANSRDARRRRRILQQGSERLALITGRIQTLPPPLEDPAPSSHPNTIVDHSDSDSISQNPQPYNHHTVTETVSEISTVPTPEPEPEPEPGPVQLQPPPSPSEEPKRFIVPSDVTRAINASRVTRLCCSVLAALLVIGSFLGTNFLRNVISFRPLYLLLLTNLTVVIARVFSAKQSASGRTRIGGNSNDGLGQLAKTLELCLVLQNVADAVFMDCAVYAVVLVCGLSLLRTWNHQILLLV